MGYSVVRPDHHGEQIIQDIRVKQGQGLEKMTLPSECRPWPDLWRKKLGLLFVLELNVSWVRWCWGRYDNDKDDSHTADNSYHLLGLYYVPGTVNSTNIFSSPYVPNAREKVNKIDKALKFMLKWKNNKHIGNYTGSWRVVRTLENGRSRVN